MALFNRWTNTVSRLSVVVLFGTPVVLISLLMLWVRTPYGTKQFREVMQPIQFDHRHHVSDEGIECRYCHTTVDKSPSAGIPSTTVCMSCHAQIWSKSPYLQMVREAYFTDRPIQWRRVHNLPDYVYFNHSIHVNKGVGCVTCHGRVDEMPALNQVAPLTMGWCVECHRHPEPNLRPLEEITSMTWKPNGDPEKVGAELAKKYNVHTRTSCTTCHR
jgi:hypothetical protein